MTKAGRCLVAASSLEEMSRLAAEVVVKHGAQITADLAFRLGRCAGVADHRAGEVRTVGRSLMDAQEKRRERRRRTS